MTAEAKRAAVEKRNKLMELKAAANLAAAEARSGKKAEGDDAKLAAQTSVNKLGGKGSKGTTTPNYVNYTPGGALKEIIDPEQNKFNFDEAVEVMFVTSLDTRKQDQQVRVQAELPMGTGKDASVVVFTAKKETAAEAKAAGADIVGGADLVEQIKSGAIKPTFDKALATPDMVAELASIAKILGPRGLMPSVKLGSVLHDVVGGVKKAKAGTVMLRADKTGVIKCRIGNVKMSPSALQENLKSVVLTIENAKPMGIKGNLLKIVYMKSTMGKIKRLMLDRVTPKSPKFMSNEEIGSTTTVDSSQRLAAAA